MSPCACLHLRLCLHPCCLSPCAFWCVSSTQISRVCSTVHVWRTWGDRQLPGHHLRVYAMTASSMLKSVNWWGLNLIQMMLIELVLAFSLDLWPMLHQYNVVEEGCFPDQGSTHTGTTCGRESPIVHMEYVCIWASRSPELLHDAISPETQPQTWMQMPRCRCTYGDSST